MIDPTPPVHHGPASGVPSTEDSPAPGVKTPVPPSYIPSLIPETADEEDGDGGGDMTRKATREELFAKAGMTPEQIAANIAGPPRPKTQLGVGPKVPSAVVPTNEPMESTARAKVADLAKGLKEQIEKPKSPLAFTVSSPEIAAVAHSIASADAANKGAPAPAAQAPQTPPKRPVHTVMGMGAVLPSTPPPANPATPPPAGAPSPGPSVPAGVPVSARSDSKQATMLGVAMPGIAPTGTGASALPEAQAPAPAFPPPAGAPPAQGTPPVQPVQPAPPGGASGAPARLPSVQPTMMGVASPLSGHPGILSVPAGPVPSQGPGAFGTTSMPVPSLVPAPAPYIDESLPAPPPPVQKSGVPLAILIPAALGVVLVVGIVAFFAFRGGAPLIATASIDESGSDVLAVKCASCPDGTKLSIGPSEAVVKAGAATLPTRLEVGPNEVKVHIDRPAGGRDEDAKLVVPVAYRLRTDPDALGQYPARFLVKVEAAPKVEVTLEGKSVALTDGKGSYEIPFGETAHGPNETVGTFERDLTYKVKLPDGRSEEGKLPLKAKIVPLRIDTPRNGSLQVGNTVWVSGQSSPGAKLTINGAPATLDQRGFFELEVPRGQTSPWKIEVRSSRKDAATRGAEVTVDVGSEASRADWLKAFEGQAKLSYGDLASDPASRAGQRIVLTGELVDTRLVGRQTVSLIEPKECAGKGTCLVRVLSDRAAPPKGKKTRVWGIVGPKPLTDNGKVIPEVDAAYIDKAP
ncbi:MAG: hypothetical protein U0174_17380 [Polyangiaceae bacterium]